MLEVLVAAAVLAIGLVAALEVVAQSAATFRREQDRSRAMMFARSKLEEILKEPVLQIGSDRGEGIDETTSYDWEAVIEESQHPALATITVMARNRHSGTHAVVTVLRRLDLDTLPDGSTVGSAAATGATP